LRSRWFTSYHATAPTGHSKQASGGRYARRALLRFSLLTDSSDGMRSRLRWCLASSPARLA